MALGTVDRLFSLGPSSLFVARAPILFFTVPLVNSSSPFPWELHSSPVLGPGASSSVLIPWVISFGSETHIVLLASLHPRPFSSLLLSPSDVTFPDALLTQGSPYQHVAHFSHGQKLSSYPRFSFLLSHIWSISLPTSSAFKESSISTAVALI